MDDGLVLWRDIASWNFAARRFPKTRLRPNETLPITMNSDKITTAPFCKSQCSQQITGRSLALCCLATSAVQVLAFQKCILHPLPEQSTKYPPNQKQPKLGRNTQFTTYEFVQDATGFSMSSTASFYGRPRKREQSLATSSWHKVQTSSRLTCHLPWFMKINKQPFISD